MARLSTIALLCLALAPPARAGVVFSQPPNPAGGLIASSFLDPDGMDGDTYPYESFRLAAPAAITRIEWRGGDRFNGLWGPQPVADFTISICANVDTAGEPNVVTAPLARYQTGGNANETPAGTFGGVPMSDYSFDLPSPFQAAGATTYWIQIEASQTRYPNGWGIANGIGGDGTHFAAVTGAGDGGTRYFRGMTGDVSFTLYSADAAVCTIAASANPPNGGLISGQGPYPLNSTATLTATPNAGFGFVNWTEAGAPVSASAAYSFPATADRALVANFTTAYTVSTAAVPGYGGTAAGDGVYNAGAAATVTATPNPGFVFVGWTGSGADPSASPVYTFPVTSDCALTANFALAPDSVLFDFDSGYPPVLPQQAATPFTQWSRGLSAAFSSPTPGAGGFSVQSDASLQYKMPLFSGAYLWPNSVFSPALEIAFGRPVTLITLDFATADFNQQEPTSTLKLTAYMDSAANPPVGSATASGAYIGATMPMGRLTFSAAAPFNLVHLDIVHTPTSASDFLVDNVLVSPGVAPYTMEDVRQAMRIAAGLGAASGPDVTRWNVCLDGASAAAVDLTDALAMLRKAAGIDPNP